MSAQIDLFAEPAAQAPLGEWTEPWPTAARFRQGDRIETRWGRATVLAVYDYPYFESARSYQVKHDWSDAPPGFGHQFGEDECRPAGPEPTYTDDEETTTPETTPCSP
jgi:hypothetical protein